MKRAVLIAAPGSGSGKTTLTLAILRALSQRGIAVHGAKSGPDYIDPRFHEAASGRPCFNLDAWAMSPNRLHNLACDQVPDADLLLIEGAMGLFDGAPHRDPVRAGKGACADIARLFQIPVVLVVDASHVAQSIAPIVAGFVAHDPTVKIGGIILNKVGSPRHEAMLRAALLPLGVPVLGVVFRNASLALPSRHLGLVQAAERTDLDSFLDHAADVISACVDIEAIAAMAGEIRPSDKAAKIPPPAQSIAIAKDAAFAFAYPHLLSDWRSQGVEISYFSPLNDECPAQADLIYLPGGYPELHAGKLASNSHFLHGLHQHAKTGKIYGECGGYMTLGEGLIDRNGTRHKMAGLLPLETSFATRKLHLGYRTAQSDAGIFKGQWAAHEFHYATTLRADGETLFQVQDAESHDLGAQGLIAGNVSGSFLHLIDRI